MMRKKRVLMLAVFVICLLFTVCGYAEERFSADPDAIEEAAQSVLMLEVYHKSNNLIATGSGFVMFDNITLVTNYHVIEGAYMVLANSDDGYQYLLTRALISSKEKDVAILRL